MATLVHQTDWTHPSSGGTSFSVTIPAAAGGNTLVFCSAGGAISTPSGFTRGPSYGGGAQDVSIWYKTAAGGETSIAVSLNGPDNVGGTILELSGSLTYSTGTNNGSGSTLSQASNYQVAPAAASVSSQSLVVGLISVAQSSTFSAANQIRQFGPAGKLVTSSAEQDSSGSTKFLYAVGIADVDASHSWPATASVGSYAATSEYQGASPGTAFACQAVFTDTSAVQTVVWPNNIVRENSLPGSHNSNWMLTSPAGTDSTIAGFPTTPSVQPGSTIAFKVDSSTNPFRVDVFRLGFYGHDSFGARLVASITGTATTQATPTVDSTLGSTSCSAWTTNASWSVPSDAVPGVYYVLFRRTDITTHVASGHFVVRPAAVTGKAAVVIPDLTHHAYSVWGATTDHGDRSTGTWTGRSLYQAGSDGASPNFAHRAYAVCLDRSYSTQSTQPTTYLLDSEFGWIQFAEAQGYDLAYLSDMDLHASPTLLDDAELVALIGHHEYWTASIYNAVQNAIAAGVNLFVYSSNTAGWRVRFASGDTSYRTAICYKDSGTRDVSAGFVGTGYDPVSPTGTWRDSGSTNGTPNPDQRLEIALTGQRFVASGPVLTQMLIDFSVKGSPIWRNSASVQALTSGNHVTDISNSIGYEVDSADGSTGQPTNLVIVASTSVSVTTGSNAAGTVYTTSTTVTAAWTLYRASSGALIFNVGSWRAWWSATRWQGGSPVSSVSVDIQDALLAILYDLGMTPQTLTAMQPGTDTAPTDPAIGAPTGGRNAVAVAYGLTVPAVGGGGAGFFALMAP